MKIGVKLSIHTWVDQLTERRHEINDVAVIKWLRDEILND